jgi:hypothetical protein
MDYIQIDRTNCMEIILHEFPAFQTQWDLHIASWNPLLDRPIALDIAEFADFAVDTICLDVDVEIDRLVAITELMLLQGNSVIEYAFRTMFLEQIAHYCNRGGRSDVREASAPLNRFINKLQPLGYYHWQAMDRSWGIHLSEVSID